MATLAGSALVAGTAFAAEATPHPEAALKAELQRFQQAGRVLYVAAHPDDENTQLITFLARNRHYRTAYLSLTRGDGGQNVLGSDLGAKLGVARTQELLAARRLDGGEQFFTRALDFGYSKDYEETLRVWDREAVLGDVVRVIRLFQPDVIVTRFPPKGGGTHGHHTASAVLAVEAFRLAADPKAYPEQLKELAPWQAKRIVWNAWQGRGTTGEVIKLSVDGVDPVHGIPFVDLAGRSRAQHKTQGFDTFAYTGSAGPRMEVFQVLAGEPATQDFMEGVDTTWNRFGPEQLATAVEAWVAGFRADDPAASVPALLELRRKLQALPSTPAVREKRETADRLLQLCLGIAVETSVDRAERVAGESFPLRHSATVKRADGVKWTKVVYPSTRAETRIDAMLSRGKAETREAVQTIPESTPVSQPYWLRDEPTTGMFRVSDESLIGQPEDPPVFPVQYVFEVGGEPLVVSTEPVLEGTHAGTPDLRHLEVVPPVWLRFAGETELFRPAETRPVRLQVSSARPSSGVVRLQLPSRWSASPSEVPFNLKAPGETAEVVFQVTAPDQPAIATIGALATTGGKTYAEERVEIRYPHIHFQLLQPKAKLRLVGLDIQKRGERVGYVPGAGDTVADTLRVIGYQVELLTGAELTADRLRNLDALVLGVRAFNVRDDLAAQMPAVFAFVENGGTVILQYTNPNGTKVQKLAPFDVKLSALRVTDETAPMTFLVPDSPVLNTPNRITTEDFEGWVQERGLHFMGEWAPEFQPILACNDRGEAPLQGGLLVAKYGKGHYVYTGLSFFRQLPAGVPGAYRLFANLVSLGQ